MGIPLSLRALPVAGTTFAGWAVEEGGVTINIEEEFTEIDFNEDVTITATYK